MRGSSPPNLMKPSARRVVVGSLPRPFDDPSPTSTLGRSSHSSISQERRRSSKPFGSIERAPIHESPQSQLEVKMSALEAKVDALAASTSVGHSDLLVGQTALGRQLLAITDLLTFRNGPSQRHPRNETARKPSKSDKDSTDEPDGPTKTDKPKLNVDIHFDDEELEESDAEGDDFSAINKFKLIDKDGSGTLDLAEIMSGAKILRLSVAEASAMFDSLEKNDDETVHMDKFLEVYKMQRATTSSKDDEKPAAHHKIRQRDADALSINPKGNFRITWDLAVMMPLLLYLTVMIPFRLSFGHEATLYSWVYWLEFVVDMLFILDMGLNFLTGIAIELKDENGEHYEAVEYSKSRIAVQYLKNWFFIDLFSGIPFALIGLLMGGSGDLSNAQSLKALRFLKLARLLKLGRLLKIEKILQSVDRGTIDMIEDFFHDALSVNTIFSLILAMAFVCHILACGFVAMGKASSEAGVEGWLEFEREGPFSSVDTTGVNGNKAVYSIYVAAFYFCLTTMISVGYGDIIPRNNSERLYVIFLEFVSSITFATIIVLITAVVTTLDVGAKMKNEALAEVGSFVDFRQFPRGLSRRIRRHFRNFYKLKTASDEKKIFEQLSTSLRKDVSQFLVLEIMGSESFFMTISASLWPRLLPLLQPMTFEAHERVCMQGEDCDEMHVVISGILTGSSFVDGATEPAVHRTMTKGDSVNVLCMLEIWYKCVETVSCGINTVETYSVKSEEFQKLFQTEVDAKNFSDLQMREIRKFKFAADPEAPTKLGKPLHFSCFSTVQIKMEKVVGPVVNLESAGVRSAHAWMAIDLVDNATGNPFNEFWDHTTEETKSQTMSHGHAELFCEDSFRWSDISVALKFASLRIRVFLSHANGGEVCVGRGMLPLLAAHAEVKEATRASTPRSKTSSSIPGEIKWESARSEESGVNVWCEIKPIRNGAVGAMIRSSLLGSAGNHSNSTPDDDCKFLFGDAGDEWAASTPSSAVKFRIFTQTPKKSRKALVPNPARVEAAVKPAAPPRSPLTKKSSFSQMAMSKVL